MRGEIAFRALQSICNPHSEICNFRAFRNRRAVVPRFRCAEVHAGAVAHHGLSVAERAGARRNRQSPRGRAQSSSSLTDSGTSASTLTSQPPKVALVNRPASSACWMSMPKSAMFADELGVRLRLVEPAHDPEADAHVALSMNAGMIVCSGRLRGAIWFGCPSSSVNRAPRLCSVKPVPGGTRPSRSFHRCSESATRCCRRRSITER